jgi:hypothetical protein
MRSPRPSWTASGWRRRPARAWTNSAKTSRGGPTCASASVGVYEKLLEDPDLLLEQRYPHNIELLREIRRQGYPTALATMSHRFQVEHILSYVVR